MFCHEMKFHHTLFLPLQATVLCDIVVLYVLQKKYFYREKKYLMVDTDTDSEPESEQVIQNVL